MTARRRIGIAETRLRERIIDIDRQPIVRFIEQRSFETFPFTRMNPCSLLKRKDNPIELMRIDSKELGKYGGSIGEKIGALKNGNQF
jgi:hypothetical protein